MPELISVIMPVRDRKHLLPLALASYVSQTHEPKELIILDDSEEDFVWDLVRDIPEVVHVRLEQPMTIGEKRNLAATIAKGEYLAAFDSDDFSTSSRLSRQLQILRQYNLPITGFYSFYLYDLETQATYRYSLSPSVVCGASLMYTKAWAKGHPFLDRNIAEDEPYCIANKENRIGVNGYRMLVVLIHAESTSTAAQVINHPQTFPRCPAAELPQEFFTALNSSQCYAIKP